jgi:hypothetical protein
MKKALIGFAAMSVIMTIGLGLFGTDLVSNTDKKSSNVCRSGDPVVKYFWGCR